MHAGVHVHGERASFLWWMCAFHIRQAEPFVVGPRTAGSFFFLSPLHFTPTPTNFQTLAIMKEEFARGKAIVDRAMARMPPSGTETALHTYCLGGRGLCVLCIQGGLRAALRYGQEKTGTQQCKLEGGNRIARGSSAARTIMRLPVPTHICSFHTRPPCNACRVGGARRPLRVLHPLQPLFGRGHVGPHRRGGGASFSCLFVFPFRCLGDANTPISPSSSTRFHPTPHNIHTLPFPRPHDTHTPPSQTIGGLVRPGGVAAPLAGGHPGPGFAGDAGRRAGACVWGWRVVFAPSSCTRDDPARNWGALWVHPY